MTATQSRRDPSPVAEERMLGLLDPSLVPEAELEAMREFGTFWYEADWEGLSWEMTHRGLVAVLSVESGPEVEHAKVAALFHCGSGGGAVLVYRHVPERGQLWLWMKPEPKPELRSGDASDADRPGAGSGSGLPSKMAMDAAADILTLLYDAPLETLRALVRVVSVHAGAKMLGIEDADRDVLLSAARESLVQIGLSELLSLKHVVKRHLENLDADDEEDEDDGDAVDTE